jgi:hypothetical protein
VQSIFIALERLRDQLAQALPATPGLRHFDVSFPLNDAFDPLAWLGSQTSYPHSTGNSVTAMKSWPRWVPSHIFLLWRWHHSF